MGGCLVGKGRHNPSLIELSPDGMLLCGCDQIFSHWGNVIGHSEVTRLSANRRVEASGRAPPNTPLPWEREASVRFYLSDGSLP